MTIFSFLSAPTTESTTRSTAGERIAQSSSNSRQDGRTKTKLTLYNRPRRRFNAGYQGHNSKGRNPSTTVYTVHNPTRATGVLPVSNSSAHTAVHRVRVFQ